MRNDVIISTYVAFEYCSSEIKRAENGALSTKLFYCELSSAVQRNVHNLTPLSEATDGKRDKDNWSNISFENCCAIARCRLKKN